MVSIKCWTKCWSFQWKPHDLRHNSRERDKDHSHFLCDLLLHATICCVPATCCVKMKPDTRKTKTTETKQPKLKETLMYYVLRPLYTLLRPPFSVFWPLQNASLHDLHKTVMLSCHKSIANVVHLWHTKNYRKSIPITRTRTRTKTRTCKRQLC